jgi:hypothetical protein
LSEGRIVGPGMGLSNVFRELARVQALAGFDP